MPRPLGWIPDNGALGEVICRTVHGRYLLRPSRDLNEIAVGILARAKRMFEMKICALIFTSSHYHMLIWVKDAEQLASFMGYVNSNLVREAGRLVQWSEKFWSRRYRAIVISDEEGGKEPLGPEAILAQDPHSHPKQPKKSPAPRFHAFGKEARRAL